MSSSDAISTDVRDVPRDRVTGVPATSGAGDRISDGSDADYIEQEIRRTRANMSATLDQIEDRLSPARMKIELKHTIDDTIADVREEYNPKRLAKRAGDTMLDTIKDHPLASLAAGLSVGYLVIKAADDSGNDRSYERRPRRGTAYDDYYGNAAIYPRGPQYAEFSAASSNRWPEQIEHEGTEGGRERADEIRDRADNMRGRMRDRAEDAGERVEDVVHESVDRAREFKDATMERSRSAARQVRQGARSAGTQLEDFLYENPLAAGAIAVGIGALVGGLFPSTAVEDRYMGPARDQAIDRARHVADETLEHGKEAAARVADEAKNAAKDVAAKGKEEAKKEQTTAQRPAFEVERDTQGTGQRSALGGDREGQGSSQRSASEKGRDADTQDRPFGSGVS